jgi:hypothetical protein
MRLTDDDIYEDHPFLGQRNAFEAAWSGGWHVLKGKETQNQRKRRQYLKKKANKAARRAVKEALRGVRPRIKKRPGDSWEVF